MLYAILCYDSEDVVGSWTKEQDDAAIAKLDVVKQKLAKQGRLGPTARLLPTTAATTVCSPSETIAGARADAMLPPRGCTVNTAHRGSTHL